ncbi:DUF3828 domain-containing protein [Pantoea sp. B65]|uniref:DUF3828 domain-containing protein n=1 Tax=Pantoea sp. B65 TaxID=2813359 RepID=UPI0039B51CCE
MRFKFLLPGFLILVALSLPARANAALQKPEDFVRQFYDWYITADKGNNPAEMSDEIYKYVAKSTTDRVRADIKRGSLPGDVAYFTKVQDYDPDEWKTTTIIHPALALSNGITLVTASFGKQDKTDIVLFLKLEHGGWKIIKVDDVLPYP